MLPNGRRLRRPPPARQRHGQGRRPRRRDRRVRAPGVHRQPDVLAPPADAPARAAGLPRSPRRPRHRPARRSMRRTSSTSPARTRTLHARSVDVLANELRVAQAYGARVRQRPRRLAPRRRRRGRDRRASRDGPRVASLDDASRRRRAGRRRSCSRTARAAASGSGATVEELGAIDAAPSRRRASTAARFGFCLDTAHLWGAGYAIDTAGGRGRDRSTRSTARSASTGCAWSTSTTRAPSVGSRADRHEHIGAGRIGGGGPRPHGHPPGASSTSRTSSRRPGMEEGYDAVNVARVARPGARAGRSRPLPPEAFHTPQREGPQRARRSGRRRRERPRASDRAGAATPARAVRGAGPPGAR